MHIREPCNECMQCPKRPEEGTRTPELYYCRCWDSNFWTAQKQQVLTTEPSPRSLAKVLFIKMLFKISALCQSHSLPARSAAADKRQLHARLHDIQVSQDECQPIPFTTPPPPHDAFHPLPPPSPPQGKLRHAPVALACQLNFTSPSYFFHANGYMTHTYFDSSDCPHGFLPSLVQ